MQGLISHIQGYSTKDGPGIRTTIFMMGCNLNCVWCSNPETIQPAIKILYHKRLCQKCGRCVARAVNNSITLGPDGCVIDRKRCSNLFEMVDICPYNAYEKKGELYSPQALADKLLKDKAFYDVSGGGITFSGGEATLQAPFLIEVIKLLKQHDIHIALDTAGLFDLNEMKSLFDLVDLILYDIKTYDLDLHKKLIGVDNKLILDNLYQLSQMGKDIIVRLIIVPTLNDQEDDLRKRLEFITKLPNSVKQVDILPYHNLGTGKYEALGIDYPLKDLDIENDENIAKFYDLSVKMNLKTTIGG